MLYLVRNIISVSVSSGNNMLVVLDSNVITVNIDYLVFD